MGGDRSAVVDVVIVGAGIEGIEVGLANRWKTAGLDTGMP